MSKLRFIRQERELNQYELAAASGVSRHAIQLCECGIRNPKLEEQDRLAEALGVTRLELFPQKEGIRNE